MLTWLLNYGLSLMLEGKLNEGKDFCLGASVPRIVLGTQEVYSKCVNGKKLYIFGFGIWFFFSQFQAQS